MSINIVVTKDGVQINSGAQYNYTRGILYPISGNPINFNRTPIDKQSSQYAYTNENPISLLAQRVEGITDAQFRSGVDVVMLMSGARNSVETKIFIGPRSVDYERMVLFDDVSHVQAEFSGEEFRELLNNDPSKFISIVYTRSSEGNSFELDLHTDETTYDNAKDYSSLDYIGVSNYPHFNQLKYSNRLVSNDDFITSSMGINNTIKYTPHFGNYYIRPDFVKAFKGFKIIGENGASLVIESPNIIYDNGVDISSITLTASMNNIYYNELYWDYYPKIPGIYLSVNNDNTAVLSINPNILKNHELYTSNIRVDVVSDQRISASKIINVYKFSASASPDIKVYVANPSKDYNPWYDLTNYLNLNDRSRMRADRYTMSTSSNLIELDQSNYRFRFIGDINDYEDDATITWSYYPDGSNNVYNTTISIIKSIEPISRSNEDPDEHDSGQWVGDAYYDLGDAYDLVADIPEEVSGTTLYSRFKVLKWIRCNDSTVDIFNKTDYSCNISSNTGLVSVKAVTLHGTYLYKEVLR